MAEQPNLPRRRPPSAKVYPFCPLDKIIGIIKEQCGDVFIAEKHGDGQNKVIFLPVAFQQLVFILSYGRRSPLNINEQKYLGYGHIFRIDKEGHTATVISFILEVPTTNRTSVSAGNLGKNGEENPGLDVLEYRRYDYLKGEAEYNTDEFGFIVDPFLILFGPSEYVMEGHTHPGIGVFFSAQDRISGAARAATAPICILVCDPIRKQLLAAVGKDFEKAETIIFVHSAPERTDDAGESRSAGCPADRTDPTEPKANHIDEIAHLANMCIRSGNCSGSVKAYTGMNGKTKLKITLIGPKEKE